MEAKEEDPGGLFTYVNYPSTEYLELDFVDLLCVNVYLEDQQSFGAYIARLQNIAGNRPLVLAEMTKAHVLVLDLSLKGVSGTDVIPAVRTAAPGTQIVVYTAFDTLARLAEEEGVADVVRKDEPEKLEAALRRVAAEHGHFVTHP